MKIRKRIFLICSERGGSNLITQIFNGHPKCLGRSPNHLYRLFLPNMQKYEDLEVDDNWNKLISDIVKGYRLKIGSDWEVNVTKEEIISKNLKRNPCSIIDYIYEKEASFCNKSILIIKEVKAYKLFPILREYYPDAKFLFQVRDPRDMVLSWEKSPVHRGSIIRGSNIWKEDQEQTINILNTHSGLNRIFLYKYEDLINNTEFILKSICNFLHIDFNNNMLFFYEKKEMKNLASNTDNWKNLSSPIMKSNFRKYKKGLDEISIKYIENVCSSEMDTLKYFKDFDEISKSEFREIRNKLEITEKENKPTYNLIPEEEKNKRKLWMEFYKYMFKS